ncbi:MAG: CAP domain-containing protein [Planctomycetes bacterium]|nr:CAP domain-containing protein [Planctomycetota bacterium]
MKREAERLPRGILLAALLAVLPFPRAAADDPPDAAEIARRYLSARRSADLAAMQAEAETVLALGAEGRAALEREMTEAAAELERVAAVWRDAGEEARAARAGRVLGETRRALLGLVRDERRFPDEDPSDFSVRSAVSRARAVLGMSRARDTRPYIDADSFVREARERVEGLAELLVRFEGTTRIPGPDPDALLGPAAKEIDAAAILARLEKTRRADEAARATNAERAGDLSGPERELLDALLEYRAAAGLPLLVLEPRLAAAARAHAAEMGELAYFGHHSPTPGRRRPSDRVAAESYAWVRVGEVLAKGDGPAEGILEAWWESPGHHRVLLDPEPSEIGVAKVGEFWVVDFARPR